MLMHKLDVSVEESVTQEILNRQNIFNVRILGDHQITLLFTIGDIRVAFSDESQLKDYIINDQ